MPTQPPYVNRAYWRQLSLLNGGYHRLLQRFTIAFDGELDTMQASVELSDFDTEQWLELEGPIWRGSLTEVGCLSSSIHRHLLMAQEYLRPF